MEVVGNVGTVAECEAVAAKVNPDVVLVDFRLPDGSGPDAAAAIRGILPAAKMIFLTREDTDLARFAAVQSGASAFLHKSRAASEVVAAIRDVARGKMLITPRTIATLLAKRRAVEAQLERLTRREAGGAALAVAGAVVVVLNGVPGLTLEVLPRWRGDILLILSGVAYASYSLLGRTVLTDTNATAITARSIVWGMLVMTPLAALEWAGGARPVVTTSAVAGTLYLALVITAGAYLVWNWALARVEAARAAPFLTVQPVVGALLGAVVLGEPVTRFTALGGGLVVLGLWMTVTGRR